MSAAISGSTGQRRKLTKCKKCSEEFPTAELRWLHLCQNIKYEEHAIVDSRDNHEKAIGDSKDNHEKAIGDFRDNHEKASGDSRDNHEKAIGDSRDNHEKASGDSDDDIQMVSIMGDTKFIRQAINQAKVNIKEETDHTSEDMEVFNENINEYNNNLNESLNLDTNASVDTVLKFETDFDDQDISNQENDHQSNSIRMSPVSELITRDCEPGIEDYERGIADSEYVKEEITIKDELDNLRQGDSANSRNDVELHRDNEVTGNLGKSSGNQPHLQTIQRERSRETTLEDGGNINNNNNVSGAVTNNPETVKISMNMEMSAKTFVRFSQLVFCAVNDVANAQQTNVEEQNGEDGTTHKNIAEENNAQINVVEENISQHNVVEENISRQNVVEENISRKNVVEDNISRQNVVEDNISRQNVVEENISRQNVVEENISRQNVVEENISRQNIVEKQNERKTLRGRKRSRSKQTGIGEDI